ncbi:hypothetical protein OS493_007790 [Desmophyllum pertusum]|uniref:G-protein coupled receptors family 1 profile domain-containing protein n=1 Tax=Desmophyllum pertusum TaxID=174260 RepID=A0A9X0CMA1_9CNID|nr:hypothetical protein OS493_007790 [Desmophyllum pertusum]
MENFTRLNATGNQTQENNENDLSGNRPGNSFTASNPVRASHHRFPNTTRRTHHLREFTSVPLVCQYPESTNTDELLFVLVCSSTHSSYACTSMDLCHRFQSISTILHLLVATSERYFKIKKPFKYNIVVTKWRVVIMLVCVWIFSLSASVVQLTWITADLTKETIFKFDFGYAVFCLVALAFLPFFVIACIDGHIFYFIHKEKKMRRALTQGTLLEKKGKQKRKQNDRKVAILYAVMTVTFVLGWFPYFIVTLLIDLDYNVPFAVQTILLFLKFSTALINPLLYTFFKTDFRKALQTMLQRDNSDGSNKVITTTV